MPSQAAQTRLSGWKSAWLYFAGILALYGVVILRGAWPPASVDYADWVYQGYLFHGALTGHPFAGYALKHYAIPNSTTSVGLGLLDCVLPWQRSGQVWILIYFALAGAASYLLLKVLRLRDWRLVVALPAILFVNLNFWYGHISFEIGMCLTLLLLALLVARGSLPLLSLLLIAIFFTHMEALACALLLLACWCVYTGEWRRGMAAIPALGLTVWYVIGRFSHGNADARGLAAAKYAYGSKDFLIYKVNTFCKTFGYINATTSAGLSQSETILHKPVFLLMVLLSLVLAGLCMFALLRAVFTRHADTTHRAIAATALGLLAIALVLPQEFLGVADPGSRLLLMAAALGFLLVSWRSRTGTLIAVLSAVFALVNLWQYAQIQRNPMLAGHPRDTPAALVKYGNVEPSMRVHYYQSIEQGRMTETIFPTGLFVDTRPTPPAVQP